MLAQRCVQYVERVDIAKSVVMADRKDRLGHQA